MPNDSLNTNYAEIWEHSNQIPNHFKKTFRFREWKKYKDTYISSTSLYNKVSFARKKGNLQTVYS
jgi:hypothetical protein